MCRPSPASCAKDFKKDSRVRGSSKGPGILVGLRFCALRRVMNRTREARARVTPNRGSDLDEAPVSNKRKGTSSKAIYIDQVMERARQ